MLTLRNALIIKAYVRISASNVEKTRKNSLMRARVRDSPFISSVGDASRVASDQEAFQPIPWATRLASASQAINRKVKRKKIEFFRLFKFRI